MKKILKRFPPLKRIFSQRDSLLHELNSYRKFYPPGHFYSPIQDLEYVISNQERIWDLKDNIPGIDLHNEDQLKLLFSFKDFYNELPFSDHKISSLRYYYKNPAYCYSDAILLFCMIRHLKPSRIVEVGSGFSSCVILDTNDLYFDNKINIQFIEPFPDTLNELISENDKDATILHKKKLQDVPLSFFMQLQANDILFIDSTHVSKISSDVNFIFHEILPILSNGVYIHFHDVFYPFEYPKEWVLDGKAWNEQYILRAFLEYNNSFKIVLFNTYLEEFYEHEIRSVFPLLFKNRGGSLWIKKEVN